VSEERRLKIMAFCYECKSLEELDIQSLDRGVLGINHPVVLKCGHASRPGYIKIISEEQPGEGE